MRSPLLVSLFSACLATSAVAGSPAKAARPEAITVEPPSWWPGHSINPVRVMVKGRNLAGARVESASAGLEPSAVKVNEAGTWLFADVTIDPKAEPGPRKIRIRTAGGVVDAPFELLAPLPREGRFQGISPDDVIYLIMPDRFDDGDPTNDDPAAARGLLDRAKDRYYHGGDLQGIIDRLPYLKDLGVTALWLNPWYDNVNHLNERETYEGRAITDYHGYGAVDFYGVEEHFGDLGQAAELVEKAHAAGLKIIQDQVANHIGSLPSVGEGLANPDLVLRHRRPAPREHLADLDVSRPELGAGHPEGDARGLVHRHPARPRPGRSRGRSLHHPEHAVVGGRHGPRCDPPGHPALRAPPLLARLDGGHQARAPAS